MKRGPWEGGGDAWGRGGGAWLVVVCVGGGGGVIRDANSRVDIFMQSGNINHIDIVNPNIFHSFSLFL